MDEAILIRKIKRRNEEAFSCVIEAYSKLLWVIAGGVLSKNFGYLVQDVEECVSDVFIELWHHPEKFDAGRGSLKTYLSVMARNKAINIHRKRNKEKVVRLEEYREAETVPDSASRDGWADQENYQALYEAVRQLPEPTREILIRRYFYEEKPRDIALKLSLPHNEGQEVKISGPIMNLQDIAGVEMNGTLFPVKKE